MAWDHNYRRLNEGETILDSDECFCESATGWLRDDGRCAGTKAPSPLYTSHRIYRRKRKIPYVGAVTHWFRMMYGKTVFAHTRFKLRHKRRGI